MLHDPTFWVAIALAVFIIAIFNPVSKLMTKGLDERAEKIKDELDEAERLRNEAQDLLAPVSYTHLTLPTICSV